ncbi:hypothetical protein GWA01_17110 [Gluconobacter wancherniae NBRC 103581]|uniref:Uncharacterized protein n=1 Tax=Gluconobacter wancherniae NBRC 103581 TaxID=656744 RepID=A0A511B355_9PROT|nr:hypothetical protein GWA01_17110 [Gluconobacter wancherniae NBRC 103581]
MRVEAPERDADPDSENKQAEAEEFHKAGPQGTPQTRGHVAVVLLTDEISNCTGRSAERGQVSSPRRFFEWRYWKVL